jgi:rhodanese-related sulfurtransferase
MPIKDGDRGPHDDETGSVPARRTKQTASSTRAKCRAAAITPGESGMNHIRLMLTAAMLLSGMLAFHGAAAIDAAQVPPDKQTSLGLYYTAAEANAYIARNRVRTLFVDVRDPAELHTLGMPNAVDANVPVQRLNFSKWDAAKKRFAFDDNPDFVNGVAARMRAKGLGRNDTVIVMCGMGTRTPKSVELLAKAGYARVYSVVDGYSGWQRSELPWDRELNRAKMYGNPK